MSNKLTTTNPPQQDLPQELPITSTTTTAVAKKVTLIPLIFLIYFEVAGGPYGIEPTVQAAGPLLAIIGFLIFPFIWSIPEALITAELSTTFPSNGGFVVWADSAFGPFYGSLMGTWKFLSGVINIAAFPVLCMDYLMRIFPEFSSGLPRTLGIGIFTFLLSFLNYTGLVIVGYVAVAVGIISLAPFILMSLIAIPHIHPHRWFSLGQESGKKKWNLFFNPLFWNLNYWDCVSTMAGEVVKPQKTFPLALLLAVLLTCLGYIFPLVAVTGSVEVDQGKWESGFLADAAQMISGEWLKAWIEIGAVLSTVGLYEAQLSSCAYQLLGMADLAFLPRFFAVRSKWFDTPWVGIVISTLFALGVSYMSYDDIISAANFIYGLGMIMEFASFLWLRRKFPHMKRPYKVPFNQPVLVLMCVTPCCFLVLIMIWCTKTVYLVTGLMTVSSIGWYFLMELCKSKGWLRFKRVVNNEEKLRGMG